MSEAPKPFAKLPSLAPRAGEGSSAPSAPARSAGPAQGGQARPAVRTLGLPPPVNKSRPAPSGKAAGTDGRLRYPAQEVIFDQGDPGGDLYFIEEGTVEIFQQRDGETIVLATMGRGEIVGVMTCMTSEPRMASARALTPVTCKRVPQEAIRKTIDGLPNWMKIVLKEFTIRLTGMNKSYTDAVMRLKKVEATQISAVYTGAQLAAAFATLSEFMAFQNDVDRYVVVDDVLSKLESALNLDRKEVDRVFNVLRDSGLLRIEIEPDKKRNVCRLDHAQKLAYFAQFVRESKHGPTKKLVRARFSNKETRVLSALVKFAMRMQLEMEKNCKLSVVELDRSLERTIGVKFERDALSKAVDLKLLSLEGEGENEVVVMRPSFLGRTVACVEAVRRLVVLDQKERADEDGAEKVA